MVVDEIFTIVNYNKIERIKVNETSPVLHFNITNKKVYYLNI